MKNKYVFVQKSLKRYQVAEKITDERAAEDIKWMLLPNGRGDPQVAIISGLEKNNAEEETNLLVDNIKFHLYTRYIIINIKSILNNK